MSEATRRQALRQDFSAQRAAIKENRSLRGARQRAALSVARMERVVREKELREAMQRERIKLKSTGAGITPMVEQYREFLRAKAEAGDGRALAELRRVRLDQGEARQRADELVIQAPEARPHPEEAEASPWASAKGLSFSVDTAGRVTYRRGGQAVLRDESRAVRVLRATDDDIETALRLARAKFGRSLSLTGSDAFQARAARVAAERGLHIDFTGPSPAEPVKPATQPGQGHHPFIEPNTQAGRYTGQIIGLDDEFIYQEHGREVIRHPRNKFRDGPQVGQTVRIMYLDQQASIESTRKKERGGPAR